MWRCWLVDVALHWYVTARGTVRACAARELRARDRGAHLDPVLPRRLDSPLVSLYLLPLTMATNLLTRRHPWALAFLTAACYSQLLATGVRSRSTSATAACRRRRSAT